MDDIRRHILHAACAACACIASPAERAHAAIVHQPVQWSVPADGQALVIDGARLHGGSGLSPAGAWRIRLCGSSDLEFSREQDGVSGLMRHSIGPRNSGPGSLPMSLAVGPLGDIGSGTAAIRTVAEIAWQDTPGLGIRVGHVPAAGPLVLLGIAALVGGPRRGRPAHGTHPVNPA